MHKFANRYEAGKMLAKQLQHYVGQPNTCVLALPRGGVPVAAQISEALLLPLDVLVVRKLGVPGHEELAMGAVARDTVVLNAEIIANLHISQATVNDAIRQQQQEVTRREVLYRGNRLFPD